MSVVECPLPSQEVLGWSEQLGKAQAAPLSWLLPESTGRGSQHHVHSGGCRGRPGGFRDAAV